MNFLEKFKGKTTLLKRDQVGQILGQKSKTLGVKHHPNQLNILKLAHIQKENDHLSSDTTNLINRKLPNLNPSNLKASTMKNKNKNQQNQNQPKKIIQNPFLIQNEFFLDQEERQSVLKRRKEDEVKQRIEKQRKKREQIKDQMMKSMKASPEKSQRYTKKQWVKLGGLGANIGSEEWTKKKTLQQKMLKFAEEIKKTNLKKIETPPFSRSVNFKQNKPLIQKPKSLTQKLKQAQIDSRTLGIKYSKSIPKPTFYTLQRTRYQSAQMKAYNSDFPPQIPRFQLQSTVRVESSFQDPQENEFSNLHISKNYSQLQRLEDRHKEFKNLIYGNGK